MDLESKFYSLTHFSVVQKYFFHFLGRMCVVRFADYRTVDRHLTSSGLEVAKAFIYESSIEKPLEVSPGGFSMLLS